MRLSGKVALITAAGQGIGEAVARAFSAEGATVYATDVNPAIVKKFEGIDLIHASVLDVLDKQAIQAQVSKIPEIDIVFNCAGFVHNGPVLDATDEDWSFAFNLNVRSQFWMIQAVLPKMLSKFEKTGQSSSIINMSSTCSSVKGVPNRFIYGSTKAAVIGLTKSVAADYVSRGIRCNCICPGTVDTPSLQVRINSYDDPVKARQDFINRQPMGRLAQAKEIAPIVTFLASDESIFATGNAYMVDGGQTI